MNKVHRREAAGGGIVAGPLRGAASPGRGADGPAAPGQTLQPTALVHEAYLRLVRDQDPGWEGRRHFFGAAAQAMREILIEQARHKASLKHGGQAQRIELAEGWPGSNRRAAICSPSTRRSSSSRRKTRVWRKSSGSAITPGSQRRGNGRGGRRVGQHLEARLALCAGLAGAAAGRRRA